MARSQLVRTILVNLFRILLRGHLRLLQATESHRKKNSGLWPRYF
jgi:hypothetical protein